MQSARSGRGSWQRICNAGPDGIGNHRTSVTEQRYVGHGSKSPESSSDTQYLCRSAPVSNPPSLIWRHLNNQDTYTHLTSHVCALNLSLPLFLSHSTKTCPHPPPKSARVGEVGWGVPSISNNALLKSGHQIQVNAIRNNNAVMSLLILKLKVFRQAVEDRHTHLYQNPYYPPPPLSRPSQPATIEDTRSIATMSRTF